MPVLVALAERTPTVDDHCCPQALRDLLDSRQIVLAPGVFDRDIPHTRTANGACGGHT